MIRVFVRNFTKSVSISSKCKCLKQCQNCEIVTQTNTRLIKQFNRNSCSSAKSLTDKCLPNNITQSLEELEIIGNPLEKDEYITPYNMDYESIRTSHKLIVESLQKNFQMTDKQIQMILSADVKKRNLREFNRVVSVLLKNGIKKSTILNYPWVLIKDSAQTEAKLEELKTLGFPNVNDLVPFLRVSYKRLAKLVHFLNREAELRETENRIQFISNKLNTDVKTVSAFLAQRLFMLEMPFEFLCQNLDNMIEYGVEPINVLKDLWAFRYTPKCVKSRLERAKIAQKDKIMPWMVRCPESILQRSLKLSIDEKHLLGDNSVIHYVSNRLGFDEATTKAIMLKHPAVLKVRVTKIKEVLDYLLIEAGVSRYDIANVIRIICHSLETTKHRLTELRSVGCNPSSLVILCRSKREYEKFFRNWKQVNDKMNAGKSSAEVL